MRLSWFRVDPESNVWCPKRMERFEIQREDHEKIEAEIRVMQLQAKEH